METIPSPLDGAPVGVHASGSGRLPLLFVHGLVGHHGDFDHQVAYFSPEQRVVTVDLPGATRPAPERSSWTMEGLGQDVAAVVDHLGWDEVVLVGHSLGGNVALEAAARLGGRVEGVVMVSSFQSLGTVRSEGELARWFAPFDADFSAAMDDLNRRNFGPDADPELVEATAARARGADKERAMGLLAAKFSHAGSVGGLLDRVEAPVFAINSDFKPNDRASFDRHGVELRIVRGAGHFVMVEAPLAFNEELRRLLAELGPRS